MNLTPNAMEVLKARYLKGNETPEQRFAAVADHVASAEQHLNNRVQYRESFLEMMDKLEFLPNTPCIANAGRPKGQLNACFVLPVQDSLATPEDDGIMDTARNAALIHQTGGGTGFDFSRLRPAGSPVASSNGVASGPVSFMGLFDAVTHTIKQGGIRRGANMGILRIDHPDIREFIRAKTGSQTALTNFNISVAVTDDFMQRVAAGEPEAQELWNLICESAWKFGDPGLFFVDAANATNPLLPDHPIRATNPCGEIPMPDNDACNLGSINLGKLVQDRTFNVSRFVELVHLGIRFLDDVVDVNETPVKAINDFTKKTRRLGLGVMGWADFLNFMEIPYDSKEAVAWAGRIGRVLQAESDWYTRKLAEEKGPYPLSKDGRKRNCATRGIAPTGSISLIAGCSPSIEPYFDTAVTLKNAVGTLEVAYPNNDKPWFRSIKSHDIAPKWHLAHQAEWQKYIDNGVSKTVNLRNDAKVSTVSKIYSEAWKLQCKGITIFRDGSRDLQVYNSSKCIEGACEVEPTN